MVGRPVRQRRVFVVEGGARSPRSTRRMLSPRAIGGIAIGVGLVVAWLWFTFDAVDCVTCIVQGR